jgi:hypothetical protein
MSCIIHTAVPFGAVVRRLRHLLTYVTTSGHARCCPLVLRPRYERFRDRYPLTLIESSFVVDRQLHGDRTKIRWHVPEQVTREQSESERFGSSLPDLIAWDRLFQVLREGYIAYQGYYRTSMCYILILNKNKKQAIQRLIRRAKMNTLFSD